MADSGPGRGVKECFLVSSHPLIGPMEILCIEFLERREDDNERSGRDQQNELL